MEFAETAARAADSSPGGRAGREVFRFGEPMLYIYLAVGGAVGTLARYGLGSWVHSWTAVAFPVGTLTVNLLGSFLLGLAVWGAEYASLSPELRSAVTVGFLGAFTTFSTLTFEAVVLLQHGEGARAALYAFGSLGLGLVAMTLGLAAGALLMRPAG